ncbi:MAG: hypothetical protein J7L47_03120 [Candidatus Odinarchaeota archaeon]|nr:hypothetical protein [Candidatus Odinarchaeota archaeon]
MSGTGISVLAKKLAKEIGKRPEGLYSTIKLNAKHLLRNIPSEELIKMAIKWGEHRDK